MNAEKRTCKNCAKDFAIEPDDSAFYKKIDVPPPTWCPECRLQRRYAFFNLFSLYKRPCDLCHKNVVSMYPPESPYIVYCPRCWWSDGWDPLQYGRDYDFSKPFFEQFNELMLRTPHLGLAIELSAEATSPYTNYAGSDKNCYLIFNGEFDEDCINGFYLFHAKNMLDTSLAISAEKLYDSMHSWKVNGGIGLRQQVTESVDISFLRDSRNCQNCFGSANLRNKKYYIFDKAYTKEDYTKELARWNLGSYKGYKDAEAAAHAHWDTLPYKSLYQDMTVNCTGNLIFDSKNCKDCFELTNCENCRYVRAVENVKDSYDVTGWSGVELGYEGMAIGAQASNILFTALGAIGAKNFEYSFLAIAGLNLFGCVSIKKGSHCILNKQYDEKEYRELKAKIKAHMSEMPYRDKQGMSYAYGEFFPTELSPYGYNETLAQDFFPMTPDDARRKGYKWYAGEPSKHSITKRAEDLPDHIKDTRDDILKESIGCAECGKAFLISPAELQILRSRNLPLPRICPICRIQNKFNMWVRESRLSDYECPKCHTSTQISENLKNKPIVYCPACYNAEIV